MARECEARGMARSAVASHRVKRNRQHVQTANKQTEGIQAISQASTQQTRGKLIAINVSWEELENTS